MSDQSGLDYNPLTTGITIRHSPVSEPRSLGAQVNAVLEQQSAWADRVAALQKALTICFKRMGVTEMEFTFAEMLSAEQARFTPSGNDGYIGRSGW